MSEKKTVYFTMVYHPGQGWTRVGNAFGSRKAAQSWVPFVRDFWRGLKTKVSQLTLRMHNGELSAKTLHILDKKFNLDAPTKQLSLKMDFTSKGKAHAVRT
jgi:hypothetical protein